MRAAAKDGRDLRAENRRAAAIAIVTFEDAFDTFFEIRQQQLSNGKHRQQWRNTMCQYVFPQIGSRSVADVSAADILKILQPIWNSKPETAKRVLQRVNATFDSAILRGSRERANPCIGVLRELGTGNSGVGHHPAMPWQDVPLFIQSLRNSSARPVTRLVFEFLILTAARSAEVRGALWDEFDFVGKTWTIPGDDLVSGRRMKSGERHIVPLTTQIVSVLEQARKLSSGPLVFPGTKGQPLSDNVLSKHMRDNGFSATPHGFRSSFKDWAAESGVRDEVSEAALAHTDRDRVRAAYRRTRFLDERRLVMQRWGDFISRVAKRESKSSQ